MLKDVRVWKNATKTETRIYVHTQDGREGVLYKTGSKYNPAGTIGGELTEDEWLQARAVSIRDGFWNTVYENQMPKAIPAVTPKPDTVSVQPSSLAKSSVKLADALKKIRHETKPQTFRTEIFDTRKYQDGEMYVYRTLDKNNTVLYFIVVGSRQTRQYDYTGDWSNGFTHTVRYATDAEIAEYKTPFSKEEKEEFYEEFFKATQYIGS